MRIGVKEEKRCPRLLYRNCIIISGIFERRSSKPRLIFASYKRHVPPICRAEVGSKIKVCHPLYPARNRATCCTTFKINSPYSSPHIRSIFLFQFNSPTFHRSYENLCRVCVARKFISRSNIEFRFPLLPLYFCYPDGIPSRFPISLARIEVHECRVDRSIRITLPAARTSCRELFSLYATVAANFRESKRTENCSSLSLYAGHSPTALRYATLLSTRSVLTTRAYIYLLTALSLPPPPPPASPAR